MNEVLIINGERYRKCAYADECLENTLEGEQFYVHKVMPEYDMNGKSLNLTLSYPIDMRFNPGETIIISKVVD